MNQTAALQDDATEVEEPSLFSATPKWVERFVEENKAALGTLEDVSRKRTKDGLGHLPWIEYFESIALGRGFSIEKVVAFIARFHHYQIIPIRVGAIEPQDFTHAFPIEFCDYFHAIPIGLNDAFLNLALLEPEMARPISEEYYKWLSGAKSRALQFFITTPNSFKKYRDVLDRLILQQQRSG